MLTLPRPLVAIRVVTAPFFGPPSFPRIPPTLQCQRFQVHVQTRRVTQFNRRYNCHPGLLVFYSAFCTAGDRVGLQSLTRRNTCGSTRSRMVEGLVARRAHSTIDKGKQVDSLATRHNKHEQHKHEHDHEHGHEHGDHSHGIFGHTHSHKDDGHAHGGDVLEALQKKGGKC